MRKSIRYLVVAIPTVFLLLAGLYSLPPVHDRLAWRVDAARAEINYWLKPPDEVVFVPQTRDQPADAQATVDAIVQATMQVVLSSETAPSPTTAASATTVHNQAGLTSTPEPSPTPTPVPTPLPAQISLQGVVHEYQKWNNCGPATLAMALSFWGWQGDQRDTAKVLKPNERDKNVMPYEMVAFVNDHTDLRAVSRVGGDLQTIKSFLAAGFPVVVEKGFEGAHFDGWMGHYEVLTGYDDARERFTAQDSYIGANLPVSYADLESNWRAFNFLYIVIYPPQREAEVQALFGPQWDETTNYQYAAQKASDEISTLSGRDQYFAWFNRGTNLMYLQDYTGAVDAYNQAFALYPAIPQKERPWRMLWYQTGPYFAYFFTQDYWNLVNLATSTIDNSNEPSIEESFYWRGRAFYALYQLDGKQEYLDHAVEDLRTSLKWHPDFGPTLDQLQQMGVTP